MNVDNQLVSDVDRDAWDWPLAIDSHNWTLMGSIGVGQHPGDVEVIVDRSGAGNQAERKKQKS